MGPQNAEEIEFWKMCYAAVLGAGKGTRMAETQAMASVEALRKVREHAGLPPVEKAA